MSAEASAPAGKKVQAKAVPMDFSKLNDDAAWARFGAEVTPLDIGVLGASHSNFAFDWYTLTAAYFSTVNNVGKSHQYVVDFVEASPQEIDDILAINVIATTRVTRMILPGMVAKCAHSVSLTFPLFMVYAVTGSVV